MEGYTGSQYLTNAVSMKDDRGEHDDSGDDDFDDMMVMFKMGMKHESKGLSHRSGSYNALERS